jgi:hypothetical protein
MQRMLFADAFSLRRSTETPSWQASAKRMRDKEEKQQFKIAVEQYYEVTLLVLLQLITCTAIATPG